MPVGAAVDRNEEEEKARAATAEDRRATGRTALALVLASSRLKGPIVR